MDVMTNLSLHKKVVAQGINAQALTDGLSNPSIRWEGGQVPVEAIIDLEAIYPISKVVVQCYYGDQRSYQFEIWAAKELSSFTCLATQNENIPSTKLGYALSFEETHARFVKVIVTGNSKEPSAHVSEVTVFGKNQPTPSNEETMFSVDPLDVAYGKTAHASSNDDQAFYVTDGNPHSFWSGELYPKFVEVDLEKNYRLSKVNITSPSFQGFTYIIYTSIDGISFDRICRIETTAKKNQVSVNLFDKLVRIIRVLCINSTRGSKGNSMLSMIQAYGEEDKYPLIPTRKKMEFASYEEWLSKETNLNTMPSSSLDSYTEKDTITALEGIVRRNLGEKYLSWFSFVIDRTSTNNYYALSYLEKGKIQIKADCGVSAATGLNYYLKYYCHVQIAQQTKQINMPPEIPIISKPIKCTSPFSVRYAYNYCTLSYTTPYYSYDSWQRELDYLMLSGVNLVLDLNGLEAVWISFLQKLGYSADEAKNYVCGYCYKAWWLMGNLEGYGGPVADSWVYDMLSLARTNQRFLTVMGAQTAHQLFVGALPNNFSSLAQKHLSALGYGDVASFLSVQGLWEDGFVRPNVLKTDYPGYEYLAQLFYQTQAELLGPYAKYYCGDVCHEGGLIPDGLTKQEMASVIMKQLLKHKNNAVWMIQAWLSNPMPEILEGFGKAKNRHLLIIDLNSVGKPFWNNTTTWGSAEFGGTPWIYSTLENFGGRTSMHGRLQKMAEDMERARKSSHFMKGIGITPEATKQNPVMFDLFFEMAWRTKAPSISSWLHSYLTRRYGLFNSNIKKAWNIFEKTVYRIDTPDGSTKNAIIAGHPTFGENYTTSLGYQASYDVDLFEKGVKSLMKECTSLLATEGGLYDIIDFLRLEITLISDSFYGVLWRSRLARDSETFSKFSKYFLEAMELIDEIASFKRDEMFGEWIGLGRDFANDSRNGLYSDFDRDMMDFNAKILLTVWAAAPLFDYANREYHGLINDAYLPQWKYYLKKTYDALKNGQALPESQRDDWFRAEWNVVINEKSYRRIPLPVSGDATHRTLDEVYQTFKRFRNLRQKANALIQKYDQKL